MHPTPNKRIAFIINNLGVGGAERVFVDDMNHLQSKGFEVFCILLSKDADPASLLPELSLPASHVHVVDAQSNWPGPCHLFRLHLFLKARKIGTIYATLHKAVAMARLLALLNPSLQLLCRESSDAARKTRLQKWIDRISCARTSRLAVVSTDVGASVLAYAPGYASRLFLLRNGVTLPLRASGQKESDYILSVGRLTELKNHRILIDGFAAIAGDFPDLRLKIIGDGPLRVALEQHIRSLHIADRVELIEPLRHADAMRYYREARIFCLPSNNEGCPNALLEAMAHALPCIAADTPGIGEILTHRISGLLFTPGNGQALAECLRALAGSPPLRHQLGEAAQDKVRTCFSRAAHESRLAELF